MNSIISKRFYHYNFPQYSTQKCPQRSPHHITPFPRTLPCTIQTLTLCSVTASDSLSCNGWDDPIKPGESNHLLNSLGLNDNKYVFVYLLGFICALAISRVKVSSIIAIPGCVIVFAIGFSFGVFKKLSFLDGDKRLYQDQIFIKGVIEKLNNLLNSVDGVNVQIGNLKKGVRKGIEYNQISVDDLQSFDKVLESINFSAVNAGKVVKGCIESLSIESQEIVSQKRKKEPGKYGFDFSQFASGLRSSKTKDYGEGELLDTKMNGFKQGNILTSAAKEGPPNSLGVSGKSSHSFDDDAFGLKNKGEMFGNASKMNVVSDENSNFSEMDNSTVKSVFNREEYSYQTSRIQYMRNQRVSRRMSHPSEFEYWASDDNLVDSMDFNVNMEQTKTEASFTREHKAENSEGISGRFGGKENDEETYRHFLRDEMINNEKKPFMASDEASNECEFGHFPSSVSSIDLQFNEYLTEANIHLKEAKDCLRNQGSDRHAENAFYKSAILLSKAIDIRPMSLLAVGQLGNTYLLHGELKLRISRDLRALLTDTLSVSKRTKIRDGLDDTVPRKEKMTSYLVNVCEECEELLIKAGRQYRLALSIDGNDVRALHNWGLALSFRAQLIADIGPGAARDADKVFLAAIDKFDAMMSRGNLYAPDALFRWATALQQRSRLRPRTSREKVKLLQQAQRLYEDAIQMDSDNLQAQEALSSCISELKYWYR